MSDSIAEDAVEKEKNDNGSYKKEWRSGWIIFAVLLILTVVEYFLGIQENTSTTALFIIALIKAVLIINFFMHIYRLWREESH